MAATGWDRGGVIAANYLAGPSGESNEADSIVNRKCNGFLENFRIENQFIYRDQLRRNISGGQYYLIIELSHLQAFDEVLSTNLLKRPADILGFLEEASRKLAREICEFPSESLKDPLCDFQVQIYSSSQPMAIRNLDSSMIGKFVRIPGIAVSASTIVARPTNVCIQCRSCKTEKVVRINSSFGGVSLPRQCTGPGDVDVRQQPCPKDSFTIVPERCRCVDQQTLKLQESHDMIPVGELPRQVLLTVDRYLVNRITPGTRLIVNGIYSIFNGTQKKGNVAIRSPYIRVLGIQQDSSTAYLGQRASAFNESQERDMLAFSRQPDLYNRFCSSIAPSIFGHEDVKKAIACLLFGGSRKVLPDKMRLRGDINVLLLGDPGVAKSQFLKFVEKVAPISVYTSGKGSSAAGLTASVVRDPSSGDFYLEGGAMVLADGGVVCIDEFDKMDTEDRVAIHEAMEQQTISIAKAGITTILNSRTSVLAAANPVFGRYDELRSPGENIDFSTTILSRFDMIFILKDEHNTQRDINMARHVLAVHMHANAMDQAAGEFDLALMKNYIAFCRGRCAPKLSAEAAEKLSNHYVSIRSQVHDMEASGATGQRSSIPITVRQLEAIIRISESLAKMTLAPQATEAHVDEALRLFRVSTFQAVLAGHSLEGMARPDLLKEVDRVEKAIRQRLPIGSAISYHNLLHELVQIKRFPEHAVLKAVDVMVQQEKLALRSQRKVLVRQH